MNMPPSMRGGLGTVRGRSRARRRDFGIVREEVLGPVPAPAAASKPAPAPAASQKTVASKADAPAGKGAAAGGKRAAPVPRRNNSLWKEWTCQEVRASVRTYFEA